MPKNVKLETVEEFLARGGEITYCRPSGFPENSGFEKTLVKKLRKKKSSKKTKTVGNTNDHYLV